MKFAGFMKLSNFFAICNKTPQLSEWSLVYAKLYLSGDKHVT
jgi:hypothetical protein